MLVQQGGEEEVTRPRRSSEGEVPQALTTTLPSTGRLTAPTHFKSRRALGVNVGRNNKWYMFEQKLQQGNTKQRNRPPGIAYRLIIPRCYRLLFSNHVLCENTSLLPPTLLHPELIGPYAPSFHSVDVIFSRVRYDFFLCLLSGACVPRHFYLFQKTQSVIAAPLIISHIVRLSPDPPYLYKS